MVYRCSGTAGPGFTLMEVLISITIVGVLALLVFTSLRLGARAWEKGEREIDSAERERVVLSLLQEQLASISTKNLALLDQKPYYIVGNQERIEFLATRQLIPGTVESVVRVVYQVKNDEKSGMNTLSVKEERLQFPKTENKENDTDDFHPLLTEIRKITIEYLDTQLSGGKYSWIMEWNGNQRNEFPRAVRLRFFKSDLEYSTVIAQVFSADLN